jgi:hypothetical protein
VWHGSSDKASSREVVPHMHVRSRLHHRRLQISLIDTRRVDGKVRQEHVASLGSVPPDMTVQDRQAFWTQVHPRLSRLDNRLGPDERARVMGELHEIVPMVPLDAAISGKIETETRNLKRSTDLRDMFQEMVDGKKALLAKLQREIAEGEVHVAKMDDSVKHHRDKLDRLEAGEDVPVSKELDRAATRAICKEAGWTRSNFHRAALMQELGGEEGFTEYLDEIHRSRKDHRGDTRVLNRVLRRQRERQKERGGDA